MMVVNVISTPTSSFFSPSPALSSYNSAFFTTSNTNLFRQTKSITTQGGKKGLSCTCLFGLGLPELVVIAGVAALVFGPKKLPEVGKSIGKTVKSFQQAAKEFESELKKEPDTLGDVGAEKSTTSVSEEEKQESGSKESV